MWLTALVAIYNKRFSLGKQNHWWCSVVVPGRIQVLILLWLGASIRLPHVVLKFSSNWWPGNFIIASAILVLPLLKNSLLNFLNFQDSIHTCSASWNPTLESPPESRNKMHRVNKRRRTVMSLITKQMHCFQTVQFYCSNICKWTSAFNLLWLPKIHQHHQTILDTVRLHFSHMKLEYVTF